MSIEFIGLGLYSVPEAARLTAVSASRIRRWLNGYSYRSKGETHQSAPLWYSQIPIVDDAFAIGFRDLAEIRIVNALVESGFGMVTIRRAMGIARDIIGDERPFSTARFKTDGRTIFIQVAEEDPEASVVKRPEGEEPLLDLLKRQYAFKKIVEPSLRDLDFDDEVAVRWWPMSRSHSIVIDPKRSFGQPIVNEGGVPTIVLADAVKAEGSATLVAKYFAVPLAAVRDAVAFEERNAA